ncbi:fumarylacetoacetate hydrolase family protein [Streptomyces sp. NBC_00005]|uniref:fumarylacetoacetate hydrolase family protein n=1 Tax=Streptomyces sp. NBC_00005 TaxID=2903609 RepID=UPI003249796B
MKLVRVAGAGTGLVVDSAGSTYVVDLAGSASALDDGPAEAIKASFPGGSQSWLPMIGAWPSVRGALLTLLELVQDDLDRGRDRLGARPLAEVPLDPPLPDPASRIFAMGGNFPMHAGRMASRMELPESFVSGTADDTPPWGFYVIPGTVVGPGAIVTPPEGTAKLDYEAEVGVVLGGAEHPRGSDRVSLWGYTAWNDFSIRDDALGLSRIDHGPLTWSLVKNFRTGNSCGPWMVVDEAIDVTDLRIRCRVNDELRQDGTTADMGHSFGRIAAHISRFVPLGGGDMILSGTPGGTAMEDGPDGAFLRDGDEVEVAVDGVAPLRNTVKMG